MMNRQKTLTEILDVPEAGRLREAVLARGSSPTLDRLDEPDQAAHFLRANLRASYLFARFAVPSYLSAVFASLTEFPPVDDGVGPMLASIADAARGELFNNNIFDRPGECHAHYHDMLEAYEAGGGDAGAWRAFTELERAHGFPQAVERSAFWSPKARQYARDMRYCCEDPLALFILMPANEELTPLLYAKALASLPAGGRFSKLRQFLERHVALDEDDHGPAALGWLDLYVEKARPSPARIREAINNVLAVFGG